MKYDSTIDTLMHIRNVRNKLFSVVLNLIRRSDEHDDSKLRDPEKSYFDKYTPLLAGTTYGTVEHENCKEKLEPALKHHYANNSHHPEYYKNGIDGMCLLDVIEMLVDWKAASERHNDGYIIRSIFYNKKRFKIDDQLTRILLNTCYRLHYITKKELIDALMKVGIVKEGSVKVAIEDMEGYIYFNGWKAFHAWKANLNTPGIGNEAFNVEIDSEWFNKLNDEEE